MTRWRGGSGEDRIRRFRRIGEGFDTVFWAKISWEKEEERE